MSRGAGTSIVAGVGGGSGGVIHHGSGPPASGSPLAELDGVNDPWRWHPGRSSWVGPAYEVSWAEGDHLDPLYTPAGTIGSAVFLTSETQLAAALTATVGDWSPTASDVESETPTIPSGAGTVPFGDRVDVPDPVRTEPGPPIAVRAGSGVVFIEQYEADYGGPTNPPAPAVDVRDYLGDLTAGDVYEWPDATVGSDGDFYLDTAAGTLYGPKTAGTWPAPYQLTPA